MQIQTILSEQKKLFLTGATLPVDFRLRALKKLRSAIHEKETVILDALRLDLRKTPHEGYLTEIVPVLSDLDAIIRNVKAWAKPRHVPTPLEQFRAKSYILPEPYGVVLIMAPWNYPFQLCMEPLCGAIAAGNCAVIKPSAYAPHTSSMIAAFIRDCFPQEFVTVIEGGRDENTELLRQKFDSIFFTGSPAAGRSVMRAAAENLTPVTLELGGKSPCIVDRSADLKLAARRIAFGKLINAGQTCVAPDYLWVHSAVKDQLIGYLIEEISAFFPGKDYANLPVIINQKHFSRLLNLMKPGNIVFGGNSDETSRFIEPTILDPVRWDDAVMKEEIFGPILPVLTFDEPDEIIHRLSQLPKPLALYLFSTDRAMQKLIFSRVSFGGGCINDTVMHIVTPWLGFGGVGESGMGSYHGKHSFDTFSHEKSVLDKANWIDLPIRYHPYSDWKRKILKALFK